MTSAASAAPGLPLAIGAAGALLQYVSDTQRSALPHITRLQVDDHEDGIIIDAATRRNLELVEAASGKRQHSLAGLLDSTATADGQPPAATLDQPPAARPGRGA